VNRPVSTPQHLQSLAGLGWESQPSRRFRCVSRCVCAFVRTALKSPTSSRGETRYRASWVNIWRRISVAGAAAARVRRRDEGVVLNRDAALALLVRDRLIAKPELAGLEECSRSQAGPVDIRRSQDRTTFFISTASGPEACTAREQERHARNRACLPSESSCLEWLVQFFVAATLVSRTAATARPLTMRGNHTGDNHGTGIRNSTSGSLSETGHLTVAQSAT
jgi:hypothetical protein